MVGYDWWNRRDCNRVQPRGNMRVREQAEHVFYKGHIITKPKSPISEKAGFQNTPPPPLMLQNYKNYEMTTQLLQIIIF